MPPNWNARIGQRIATFGPNSNPTSFAGLALFDAMTGQWHDLPAAPSERVATGSISASTGILLLVRADQSQYLATWTGCAGELAVPADRGPAAAVQPRRWWRGAAATS